MKKIFVSVMTICLLVLTASFMFACGEPEPSTPNDTTTTEEGTGLGQQKTREVNYDFSTMTKTVVSGQLQEMNERPDLYTGKYIRAKGTCSITRANGKTYYAVSFEGADSCCPRGLEFVLKDSSQYPPQGAKIAVTGKFATYKEQNASGKTVKYIHLIDAVLT